MTITCKPLSVRYFPQISNWNLFGDVRAAPHDRDRALPEVLIRSPTTLYIRSGTSMPRHHMALFVAEAVAALNPMRNWRLAGSSSFMTGTL